MKKTIKFYRRCNYGRTLEYIHPDCAEAALILLKLTGNKTVDGNVRELVRDLSGGMISWEEVLAP